MEQRITNVTKMASEFYGPGSLRISVHGHAFWAAENGVEYALGWSIFEAETTLRRALARKKHSRNAESERKEEEE